MGILDALNNPNLMDAIKGFSGDKAASDFVKNLSGNANMANILNGLSGDAEISGLLRKVTGATTQSGMLKGLIGNPAMRELISVASEALKDGKITDAERTEIKAKAMKILSKK